VAYLPSPWPREGALVDLRYHTAEGRIPGRRALAERWGWSTTDVRELLDDRAAWLDRSLPPPVFNPPPGQAAQPERPRRYRRSADRPTHLHLDTRWRDVLALARSHPQYRECLRLGWDREDLDQEIVTRIAAKQDGASAYDRERAGVGKYLWTATRSIVLHLLEQRTTAKATQVVTGVEVVQDGRRVRVDASAIAIADPWDPVADIDARRRG
ncbi:MAG: hypothetical protein ABMA64_24470, partial [Myxococcota bacterium]